LSSKEHEDDVSVRHVGVIGIGTVGSGSRAVSRMNNPCRRARRLASAEAKKKKFVLQFYGRPGHP
jgi:hypothetical protein